MNPIVAKPGGDQSQGAKGEAVVIYCDPLVTKDLGTSGFPAMAQIAKARTWSKYKPCATEDV